MDECFEQVNNRFGDMLDFFYILTGIFVALSVANITLRLKACADLICSRRPQQTTVSLNSAKALPSVTFLSCLTIETEHLGGIIGRNLAPCLLRGISKDAVEKLL